MGLVTDTIQTTLRKQQKSARTLVMFIMFIKTLSRTFGEDLWEAEAGVRDLERSARFWHVLLVA